MKNIGRFEGRAQFSTWLTRIGINEEEPEHQESADLRREERRQREPELLIVAQRSQSLSLQRTVGLANEPSTSI